jgi:hypothetical protein
LFLVFTQSPAKKKSNQKKKVPKSKRNDGFPSRIPLIPAPNNGAGIKTHTIVSSAQGRRFRLLRKISTVPFKIYFGQECFRIYILTGLLRACGDTELFRETDGGVWGGGEFLRGMRCILTASLTIGSSTAR